MDASLAWFGNSRNDGGKALPKLEGPRIAHGVGEPGGAHSISIPCILSGVAVRGTGDGGKRVPAPLGTTA